MRSCSLPVLVSVVLLVSFRGFAGAGYLSDPDGLFSGRALGGEARLSEPDFYLRPHGGCDWPCIHSGAGHVDFDAVFKPLSATISSTEFYLNGFSLASNGLLRLELPYGTFDSAYGSVLISAPPLAWGTLYDFKSVHRCRGGVQSFCYACGRNHAVGGEGDCSHEPNCAARQDVRAGCSCDPIFVLVNWDDDNYNGREDRLDSEPSVQEDETVLYRALGVARECCCDYSFGRETSLRNINVSSSLRNWDENGGAQYGGGIVLEAVSASPSIGGSSLSYDIFDKTNSLFRSITRRVTAANVRCRLDRNDDWLWSADDAAMADWFGPLWTVYRRSEPYVFWVDCEKPEDMDFVIFCSMTNQLMNASSSGQFPRRYELDASCSNTTFEISCALSTGLCTFVSTSFTVKVVDTSLSERTIVIGDAARYEIAGLNDVFWRVSNLEDTEDYEYDYGSVAEFGSNLPIGDYLVWACMPGIGDYGSIEHCSTNVLHVIAPKILSIDLMDAVNELEHHTDLYSTNALVVRRAQKFRISTKMSKSFNPDRFSISFKMVDEFGVRPTTNDVPCVAHNRGATDWYAYQIESSMTTDGYPNVISEISLPSTNCAVGVYHVIAQVALKTEPANFLNSVKSHRDIIVLFNPWSPQDSVFMNSPIARDEYLINQSGLIWVGKDAQGVKQTKNWRFGQFDHAAIETLLVKLTHIPAQIRSSAALLSRRATAFCSTANESDGLLVGRWSAPYAGGEHPSKWMGSGEIFARWLNSRTGVRYGQCWVFSGLLSSILRCVGIPSRPVTNYESGHDSNLDGCVELYCDSQGKFIPGLSSESTWNFHVWTEAWHRREDSAGVVEWHVVDATPQEISEGLYQCGPASKYRVRNKMGGEYDVQFVTSEVDAVLVLHIIDVTTGREISTRRLTGAVGFEISTKAEGSWERHDVTGEYK